MTARGPAVPFSRATQVALVAAGLHVAGVYRVISAALAEDLRYGPDATSDATVPITATAVAQITPRTAGVLAGVPVALAVFDAAASVIAAEGQLYTVVDHRPDGSAAVPGEPAIVLRGNVRHLLTAERTALNLICHLSGIATVTRAWVDAVEGTGCTVRDTRKTLPGLRELEKYAVRCGGGANHRLGLGDAVLIKDNHVRAAGSVAVAIGQVRLHAPHLPCEVEVDTLEQLDEALAVGAELVLLDNFTPDECALAVHRVRATGSGTILEASGGLTLAQARRYAETGVDYLAVGALTHSAPALDLGMDLAADPADLAVREPADLADPADRVVREPAHEPGAEPAGRAARGPAVSRPVESG